MKELCYLGVSLVSVVAVCFGYAIGQDIEEKKYELKMAKIEIEKLKQELNEKEA